MILFIVENLDRDEDKKLILDIYEKYAPWLRSRAYKITNDYEISNDLVHDCIINLIKHVDKLHTFNDSQLRAYIAITIDNISKNHLKHSSRTCLTTENEECFFDNIPDEDNIENIIENKFRYESIRKGFEELPERDRSLLIFKYDLELSDKEIAPIFGINENSVRMTIRRSINKLSKKVMEVAFK